MTNGIIIIATPEDKAVAVEFVTRENWDNFINGLFADKETCMQLSQTSDNEGAVLEVISGRRPFKIAYSEIKTLYTPTFKLDLVSVKVALSRVPRGQKAKP